MVRKLNKMNDASPLYAQIADDLRKKSNQEFGKPEIKFHQSWIYVSYTTLVELPFGKQLMNSFVRIYFIESVRKVLLYVTGKKQRMSILLWCAVLRMR